MMNNASKTVSVELLQQPQTNNGLSMNIAEMNRIISLLDHPFETISKQLDNDFVNMPNSEDASNPMDLDKARRNFTSVHLRSGPVTTQGANNSAAKVTQDLDHLLSSLTQYQMNGIGDSTNYISGESEYLYNGQIITSKPPPPKKPLPVSVVSSNNCDSLFLTDSNDRMHSIGDDKSSDKLSKYNQKSSRTSLDKSETSILRDTPDSNNATIPLCLKCNEPISENSISALDGFFHADHFTCNQCDTRLMDGVYFINNETEVYCENCHTNLFVDKCAYCGEPIQDTALTALDQHWHPEHFFCFNCQAQFTDDAGFHEHEGKPYCKDCYFYSFAPRCAGCQNPITATFLNAMGAKWHEECFVCKSCQKPFQTMNFREYQGEIYCEQHYREKIGDICGGCKKSITNGTLLTALGQRFHPTCFRCQYCQKGLSRGSFKENNGRAYCLGCYNKLLRP